MNLFWKFEIMIMSIIYYNIVINEIIQSIAYDDYDNFQHLNLIFS